MSREREEQILCHIRNNQSRLKENSFFVGKRGVFQEGIQHTLYGGQMAFINSLDYRAKGFLLAKDKYGRVLQTEKNSDTLILRGHRYFVARDGNIPPKEKIDIYTEDYRLGMQSLFLFETMPEDQHLAIAPVLDYMKNTVVTLFNMFIAREKIGEYRTEDKKYQRLRKKLADHVQQVTVCYYLTLVDNLSYQSLEALKTDDYTGLILQAAEELKQACARGSLGDKNITITEGMHPVINMAFAEIVAQKYPDAQTIVSMPNGSTEVACVVAGAYRLKTGVQPPVVFLPYSLHSVDSQFGNARTEENQIEQFLKIHQDILNDKRILIVDDNSSTGKTIEGVADNICKYTRPTTVQKAVAEADIIRTRLFPQRPQANIQLYTSSVGVLPVFRNLHQKKDMRLKQIDQKLVNAYMKKAKESTQLGEKIQYEVCADLVRFPIEDVLKKGDQNSRITQLSGTALSNFYAVPVRYQEMLYPSVEHAYQHAKFSERNIDALSQCQKQAIEEYARTKGFVEQIGSIHSLFMSSIVSPGTIKGIADILRGFGLQSDDWDGKKIVVMIDLLLQKYRYKKFAKELLSTDNRVIIEGNDWHDVFWGMDTETHEGKNMLGRILMNIRGKLASGAIIPT